MATSLNWKSSEDTRDIVHLLVQALVEGNLVVLPAETTYHVFASALHAPSVERLLALHESGRLRHPSLFLRSGEEALDYAPHMSRVAQRAVHRGWPGPLVLELPVEDAASIAGHLPEVTRRCLLRDGQFMPQRVATHAATLEAMRLMSGPLVAAACMTGNEPVCSGEEAQRQFDSEVALLVDDGETHFGGFATSVRVNDNQCQVTQTGIVEPERLDQMFEFVLLLVCTGNTCRSPMAETLMKHLLQKAFPHLCAGEHQLARIVSAGLSAFPGGPASAEAQSVMKKRGLSLKDHQSQTVTERGLRYADLVLTMTRSHRAAIVDQMPHLADKVRLLSGNGQDVSDPFGGSEATYAACADQIEGFLDSWIKRIDANWFPEWLPAIVKK